MCPHEEDTNGDAGTKRRKQTAFSCPPTSPAFSKELQSQSCWASIIHARLWFFLLFFPPSAVLIKSSSGQRGSSLRNGFYLKGTSPQKKKGNGAACGVEAVMDFATETQKPAAHLHRNGCFQTSFQPANVSLSKKSANHSFQAPSVTPWRATTLFFFFFPTFVVVYFCSTTKFRLFFTSSDVYLLIYLLEFLSI